MKKLKVVEFFGEPLNYGGQEAFILNMYKNFSENIKFMFITPFEATNENLIQLVKNKKDQLTFDNKNFNTKLRKKHIIDTANKYLSCEYDVIHIHSGSLFTLYNVAKIAKKKKIKKVIVHSHSVGIVGLKNKVIRFISRNIGKYVDVFLACTLDAGKSKFPSSIVNSKKFFVINNGINLSEYVFDDKIRTEYRKKFNVEDKFVLINIGRFCKEKNQVFLIELFNKYFSKNNKSHLFLVGGHGEELNNVELKIAEYKLEDNVTILKNRNDVNCLLFMSDVFLLPSLWEGLPLTGIEAQTTGIPCVFSDNITDKVNVSKAFHKMSLDSSMDDWINLLDKLKNVGRYNVVDDVKKHGYDSSDSAKKLEDIYLEEI